MGDQVKVQELDPLTQDLYRSLHKGMAKLARFGDDGYIMSIHYKDDVDFVKNMAVRSDDVWVNTFPRSGTTRTQELIWLLMNDFDYDTASKLRLTERFVSILPSAFKGDQIRQLQTDTKETVANAPSPRFIKTHISLSLLPEELLDTTKVVYVARDPRDVAVSWYHHNRLILNYQGDFKSYWNFFVKDLIIFTPYFSHLKEAWAVRHHPNLLFLFYEEMSKDLPASIKRIATFLNLKVTNEQIAGLCEHLDINNFRNNKSVNRTSSDEFLNPNAENFIRKGKAGGWREHFDAEMAAQAQEWMRENLAGTDIRFPDYS